MEKRRLLLVVMLLATSGAVLATKKGSGTMDDGRGGEVSFSWWNKYPKKLQIKWHNRKSKREAFECAAGVTLVPVRMVQEASLARFCNGIWHCRPKDLVGAGLFGTGVVGLGLGIGFYLTATSEPVQEGVKKFVRGVRRTLSFRKKTPEKKTDASAISA